MYENECPPDEYVTHGPDPTPINFTKDPLYYHKRVYVKLKEETEKAYLLTDEKGDYWIPKKLITIKREHCYQWNKFKPIYIDKETKNG